MVMPWLHSWLHFESGHPADGVYCNKEGPTQWEDSLLHQLLSFYRIERFIIFVIVAFEPLTLHHRSGKPEFFLLRKR